MAALGLISDKDLSVAMNRLHGGRTFTNAELKTDKNGVGQVDTMSNCFQVLKLLS